MKASCFIGGAFMLYKVKIKIRVNSAITNTTVEVYAANAVIAKALAEQMYGMGNTNGYSLQPTCAQSRMPMERIVSGACVSFFHASHAASTIAS